MARWIFLVCLMATVAVGQDSDYCESENDCTCHQCNQCSCWGAGEGWACTEMGCGECSTEWIMMKNYTDDGAICNCKCAPEPEPATPEPDNCMADDCSCDVCNLCSCVGDQAAWGLGNWACTRMACAVDSVHVDEMGTASYCSWETIKEYDSNGHAQCRCECVTYPSAATAGPQATALLVMGIASVVAKYLW